MRNNEKAEKVREIKGETAVITDIQRYSVHDGPGIRTLVFLRDVRFAASGAIIRKLIIHFQNYYIRKSCVLVVVNASDNAGKAR